MHTHTYTQPRYTLSLTIYMLTYKYLGAVVRALQDVKNDAPGLASVVDLHRSLFFLALSFLSFLSF